MFSLYSEVVRRLVRPENNKEKKILTHLGSLVTSINRELHSVSSFQTSPRKFPSEVLGSGMQFVGYGWASDRLATGYLRRLRIHLFAYGNPPSGSATRAFSSLTGRH